MPARTSEPDAPPAGGAGFTGAGFTAVGFGTGFAVGAALADLLGVEVIEALAGAVVAAGVDEPAPEAVALEAAGLETTAVAAALETLGPADEAALAAPLSALDGVPSGAA